MLDELLQLRALVERVGGDLRDLAARSRALGHDSFHGAGLIWHHPFASSAGRGTDRRGTSGR